MDKEIRILLIEDNYSDAELIKRELRKGGINFTARWAQDKQTFLEALDTFTPDLVLLDYSLPGFDAMSALAMAQQRFEDIPVIIVSGAIGEEAAIEALKAGAVDYVLKQRLTRLNPVVQRALQESEQLMEKRCAEKALRVSEARFRLLSDTAGRLLTSEDPQSIVDEVCRQVMEHLGCDAFFNFLVDEHADQLHLNTFTGISGDEAGRIQWLDYGESVCSCVDRECGPGLAEDIQNSLDARTERIRSYGIQAYACHPMTVEGRLIGTLSFATKRRQHFSAEEVSLMKIVTDQVATTMERMRLIKELERSRDELEIRVHERTTELEKVNEEQKVYVTMLEQANRELADFAHVASHDLQEPLRKIQTLASRLAAMHKDTPDDKELDYLGRMQRTAWRMQDLLLDLLRYSRISSRPPSLTSFSLAELIDEIVSDMKSVCEEEQCSIDVDELPEIEADREQMRLLFQHLIGNALKYHGEHRPLIQIFTDVSCAGPFWHIHVKDNGIGFDECYLDRIFRPFQRLHSKTSPYQGTGIGLSICRRIVERHGGAITARSRPGGGATFIVKLPKMQPAAL